MEKIIELLIAYFTKKQTYEWRFFTVNGSEPNNQIKIANSIQYEFINNGNSIAIINDSLKIYPYWMGVAPYCMKFELNKNEVDVGVYEYRFENVKAGDLVWGYQYTAVTSINIPIGFDPTNAIAPYNSLQVSVKVVSKQ